MRIKQSGCKVFLTQSEVAKIEQMMGEEIKHKLPPYEVEIGCKCDICEKPIEWGSHFFHVLTGHRVCGNLSQKWFDICSQECLREMYRKFDEMSDYTKYMEISQERM